jgi:hypothetical protein
MPSEETLTYREFIRSFQRKELDGFASYYRGRQRALPEISPKRMPRAAWKSLFETYLSETPPRG